MKLDREDFILSNFTKFKPKIPLRPTKPILLLGNPRPHQIFADSLIQLKKYANFAAEPCLGLRKSEQSFPKKISSVHGMVYTIQKSKVCLFQLRHDSGSLKIHHSPPLNPPSIRPQERIHYRPSEPCGVIFGSGARKGRVNHWVGENSCPGAQSLTKADGRQEYCVILLG